MMKKNNKGFIKVKHYDWDLHPKSERLIMEEINRFLGNHSYARKINKIMKGKMSTNFIDWIDHIVIPKARITEKKLAKLNFIKVKLRSPEGTIVYKNSDTIFPPILLSENNTTSIGFKTENIENFMKKTRKVKIEGDKFSPYRIANLKKEKGFVLNAVERRGSNEFITQKLNDIKEYKKASNLFKKRKRKFRNDEEGLIYVKNEVRKVLKYLSPPRTADAFFRNERKYWEKRNSAGKIQRKRQDILGLGWGNHDHHTYRSSREHFTHLIEIFEDMGYYCRERFFAGEAAGWGAQILEHPQCDIVVFADTDITKKEKDKDFAHKGLRNKKKLGTVGLWVGLHGESILQSGMHHLEARFDFDNLGKDLQKYKTKVMKPFSNFPFLKQAFTEGERWKVDKKRVSKLLRNKSITKEQYEEFIKYGAIGSHLENLQRKQGFKGFNQDSVTAIIKATDPRKYHFHKGA